MPKESWIDAWRKMPCWRKSCWRKSLSDGRVCDHCDHADSKHLILDLFRKSIIVNTSNNHWSHKFKKKNSSTGQYDDIYLLKPVEETQNKPQVMTIVLMFRLNTFIWNEKMCISTPGCGWSDLFDISSDQIPKVALHCTFDRSPYLYIHWWYVFLVCLCEYICM